MTPNCLKHHDISAFMQRIPAQQRKATEAWASPLYGPYSNTFFYFAILNFNPVSF
jgi:hypothetical protein